MKRAALHNLGCKVNACETEAMELMLIKAGYEIVPFDEKADVYVINTCTVTNIADHKSRQMLHKARKMNADAVIVAAGCYVQSAGNELLDKGDADIIIGNDRKQDLIRLIDEYYRSKETGPEDAGKAMTKPAVSTEGLENCRISMTDINEPGRPFEELGISHPHEHTRAFIKIQDGCSQFCSYCAIPYARGRARSREPGNVITEAGSLAADGYKEIVLTGIHLSSYGMDLTGRHDGSPLTDLIRKINDIDGIRRIRLGSLEPGIITEDFMRELSGMDKVCPHFHLSLQSGSNTVLKRMNRHYTSGEYAEKCGLIRDYYEHPALTTDIIVGFPGETDEEFEETLALVRKVGFYQIHVFKYSRRDGTPAAKMENQIPGQVKAARSRELMTLSADQETEFKNWYRGRRAEVLFEDAVKRDGRQIFTGFTPEYIRVSYPSEEDLRNRILPVEISEFLG